jgi:DNA-binding CsgD family transcriptional regulator
MPDGILGREGELMVAAELIKKLEHGPAALVFAGEAGIGKTTLWREAVDRSRAASMTVLVASPAAAEASLAFAALADLLEPVVDGLLPKLSGPQRHALAIALLREDPGSRRLDQRAASAGVLSLFRMLAATSSLLVAIDDLQWLDHPSAHVLGYAMRRLGNLPVGVLACERLGENRELPLDLRAALVEDRFIRMELGPLSLAALHELLKQRLGRSFPRRTLTRIDQVAGGNPFFALEIGRALREDLPSGASALPIPENLSQLVEGRIASLPKVTRMTLLAAASLRAPTVEVVASATGTLPSTTRRALERAAEAGLVGLDASNVRFSHPLYAAVAYSSAAPSERRLTHSRLAMVSSDIEERARHRALSAEGADEQVAALLEAAAEHALSRGAPETAAELADHARLLTPQDQPARRQRRSIQAAEYRFHSGEREPARLLLEEVLREAPAARLQADVLVLLGEIRYHENSFPEAIRHFEQALEHVGDALEVSAAIETQLTYSFNAIADWAGAERHASRGLELAEQAGERGILAEALAVHAILSFLLGRGLDRAQLKRALELEDVQRQVVVEMRPSLIAGCLALYLGELDRSIAYLSVLRERALEHGAESDLVYVSCNLAWAQCWKGNLGAAATYADEAIDTAKRIESDSGLCAALAFGALAAAFAGDVAMATSRAAQSCAMATQTGYLIAIMWANWALGFLELARGNPQAVDAVLGPFATMIEHEGLAEPVRAIYLADEIEALIALGQLDRAERLTAILEEAGTRLERQWTLVGATRSRALLLAARGDLDAASQAASQAVELCDGLELVLEVARSLLVAGGVERRRRRKRAASDLLQQSLEIFEQAGARLWAEKAHRELDRVGLHRVAGKQLSATEQRVAELAASGLTNRQVAGALFMSPKTVEANLAHVYAKLGIRSRAELGARVSSVLLGHAEK